MEESAESVLRSDIETIPFCLCQHRRFRRRYEGERLRPVELGALLPHHRADPITGLEGQLNPLVPRKCHSTGLSLFRWPSCIQREYVKDTHPFVAIGHTRPPNSMKRSRLDLRPHITSA